MSTARADRASAEAGVQEAYGAAGLRPPQRIIWSDGPHDLARSGAEAGFATAGENVKAVVVDAVVRQVAHAVDKSVGTDVRKQISATFRSRPLNPTSAAVMSAVTLAGSLPRERRWVPLRSLLRRLQGRMLPRWMEVSFRDNSFCQHEAISLGIFEYLHEACALHGQTRHALGLCRLARNAGWIVPHERVCWLVDRHSILAVDDRGRLHNAKGPAIAFADGWSIHAWKGVRIPAWMIERPHEITASRIDRERDPVVRRCMIDIMTPERFIREGNALCLGEDDTGILWSKSWTTWDTWAAVQVQNGTPEPDGTNKQYYLQVPPAMRSPRQAVAWTYGMTDKEYASLKHRT